MEHFVSYPICRIDPCAVIFLCRVGVNDLTILRERIASSQEAFMPHNDTSSPRRSQLNERTLSSQSVSRASPTAGQASKAPPQKKQHMAHAVGHHRHSHTKISSYGKNLNKLSKLTAVQSADERALHKQHAKTHSRNLSSSPTPTHIKRNSSNGSLTRTGSKVSMQRDPSTTSLKRNTSAGRIAGAAESHLGPNLRNGSSGDFPARGRAKFSIGDEDQEEEWVPASGSQSPDIPKQGSIAPKPPQLEEPPSPDDPQGPSPPVLPHSPPQSPPARGSEIANQTSANNHRHASAPAFHPPHPKAVTHRLLSRHRPHNAAPQMSSISATVTPSGSSGSPAFSHAQDTGLSDPSMPADGISRFLNPTGSASGSVTPGSISQIQSALAGIRRTHQHDRGSHPLSSGSSPVAENLEATRRAKSTGNLSTPNDTSASSGIAQSVSPPQVPTPTNTRASPFKSANEPREAARSLTQLKLDLQRISSNREPTQPPSVHPPSAMIHGVYAMAGMASAVSGELSAERRIRQYEQAGLEFRNARRFNNMLSSGMARIEKRRDKKKTTSKGGAGGTERDEENKIRAAPGITAGVKPPAIRRGRVRFEVGRKEAEAEGEDEEEEDEGGGGEGGAGGGLQGLLKRIWEV